MADNVKEEIVFKKKKAFSSMMYVLMAFFAIIGAILGAIGLMGIMGQNGFQIDMLIMFIVFGGSAVAMWFGKDYLRVEYEYSFTNGIVDIAQVVNNRKRKEIASFKTREVEIVAPINDPKLHAFESRQGIKKVKAVLMDSDIYFAVFRKNEVQYLLYFEPSKDFLKMMRIYNDRNVTI